MTDQQSLDTGTDSFFHGDVSDDCEAFIRLVNGFYARGKRPMPWRDNANPYWVVVSEVMLQQTQVPRVLEKFPEFILKFPDFFSLSQASLYEVLEAWQGLGYNRRAKYLHNIAGILVEKWGGVLPKDPDVLITFPGIGAATAGSIITFAYNVPVVFIETNIRRVYIHHFFPPGQTVADQDILPLIAMTLDRVNPREWYYALMDYGTWLKSRVMNPNRRSKHYHRQSPFEGSDRQIRGQILKLLLTEGFASLNDIIGKIEAENFRVADILSTMIKEGLLQDCGDRIKIAE